VWLYEIATERMTALTPANQTSWGPIWSADGKALLYSVDRPDRSEIVMDRLDGTTPEVMGSSVNDLWPTGFTSDGSLIVNEDPPTENFMVSRLRPGPDARPTPFADGPTTPSLSRPSPDGMWVAFNAMEGGRFQLFVQPASPGGVRRQVTVDGGREPVWRRDGRELYFRRNDEVLAMTIQPGSALTWSRPTVLFKGSYSNLGPDFDVAPDGRLLLLKEEAGPPPPSQLNVVVNWAAELQSRGVRPE
jgi:Tol biopolymer transport system component